MLFWMERPVAFFFYPARRLILKTQEKNNHSLENTARELAEEALTNGIRIYDFQIGYLKNEIKIRVLLDKLSDPRGSVTIEECEEYTHLYRMKLDSHLSEDDQYRYSLEVSSAGAEREIRLPDELNRFKNLPMTVSYEQEGKNKKAVMNYLKMDTEKEITSWKLAGVKFNKNQGLTSKNTPDEIIIPVNKINKVNLYLDF